MRGRSSSGFRHRFQCLFRIGGQITHVLLTLTPLSRGRSPDIVRLACLIHAASVHSEPGSNSPLLKSLIRASRRDAANSFFGGNPRAPEGTGDA